MSTPRETPPADAPTSETTAEPEATMAASPAEPDGPAGVSTSEVPDVPPVAATPAQVPVAEATQPVAAPRPGASPLRFLVRLVRLLFAVLLIAAIIVGVVVGGPILYDRYVAPIGMNTADLGAVRDRLAEIETQLDAAGERQAALDARLGSVEDQLAGHDRRLASLDAIAADLGAADTTAADAMAREVSVLKAMELMSRARLFLYESNFGLAAQDLSAARDLLEGLEGGTSGADAGAITTAVNRLDRTLAALPDFPVVASDDLDIAWQALLGNVPPAATPTPSLAPAPSAAASPGATPEPSSGPRRAGTLTSLIRPRHGGRSLRFRGRGRLATPHATTAAGVRCRRGLWRQRRAR